MLHKCKMTILGKKLYPELQEAYCADPQSGPCPCYHVGDQYLFERYDGADDFWKMGAGTLIKATHGIDGVAGGPGRPHCSELWDAVSRYIYTALQGGVDVAADRVPQLGAVRPARATSDAVDAVGGLDEGAGPHLPEVVRAVVPLKEVLVPHMVAGAGAGLRVGAVGFLQLGVELFAQDGHFAFVQHACCLP